MSKLLDRVLRTVFVVAVTAVLALGAHTAFAAERDWICPCDPFEPGANEFCVRCCDTTEWSMCPWGPGGLRECLCDE